LISVCVYSLFISFRSPIKTSKESGSRYFDFFAFAKSLYPGLNEKSANESDFVVHASGSSAHASDLTAHASDPSAQESDSTVFTSDLHAHESDLSAHESDRIAQVSDPPAYSSDRIAHASDPSDSSSGPNFTLNSYRSSKTLIRISANL